MAYLPSSVHRIFAGQHGVASLDQLRASGLSDKQIEMFERRGAIVSVVRGAYRSPSVPDTELVRCAALCLAHPQAAIAGPTAGRIWGLRRLPHDRRIHLIAPRSAHPSTATPWVVTYHTDAVREDDIVQRNDGIRVTSPPRTAMDLARATTIGDLRSIIEQVVHDGSYSTVDMLVVGADFVRRRPWVRRYMDIVGSRLAGGAAESHAEVIVGEGLADRGLHGLVRQHQIRVADRTIRFDLAVPELRWAIEVDVFPTHLETAGAASDRSRDVAASHAGWRTSRISRADYENRLDETLDAIADLHLRLRNNAA